MTGLESGSEYSEKIEFYVTPETKQVVEALKDASKDRDDMWDMSISESTREYLNRGIATVDQDDPISDLVDDLDLQLWQNQQNHEQRLKDAKFAEMAGGWRGRVDRRMNKRLAQNHPYSPEKMEALCVEYWGEIEDWERNEEKLPEHREWLDKKIEEYKVAYEAWERVGSKSFVERHEHLQVGYEIGRLKDRASELFQTIERKASNRKWDSPDAIRDSIATEFAVEPKTVDIVLDYVIPEDVSPQVALMNGADIREILPNDALKPSEMTFEELESGQVHEDRDGFDKTDDNVETAQIVIEDPDRIDDLEPEIDDDALEARIGGDDQ